MLDSDTHICYRDSLNCLNEQVLLVLFVFFFKKPWLLSYSIFNMVPYYVSTGPGPTGNLGMIVHSNLITGPVK